MAETLGSLCDKLTIVKLKQYHSEDSARLTSLEKQQKQLVDEINQFVAAAIAGDIEIERLTFASNKVYKKEGNEVPAAEGTMGNLFAQLAQANCELWHQQERVYNFENIPVSEKDQLVKSLAQLNLKRTHCIDAIDRTFKTSITELKTSTAL